MKIEGVVSILYRMSPLTALAMSGFGGTVADLLDWCTGLADLERWNLVKKMLGQLEAPRMRMRMTRQDEMRWLYLRGLYLDGQSDWRHAFALYDAALDIALELNDIASVVVLASSAAAALHDDQKFSSAYEYFVLAYDAWLEIVAELPEKPVETNLTMLYLLSRELWLEGAFDQAHAHLAYILTRAENLSDAARLPSVHRNMGHARWLLALVFRCQSDLLDGDLSYLLAAEQCFKQALGHYDQAGVDANNRARYHVQMGELYLDIAEFYLSEGDSTRALKAREQGRRHAKQAQNFFTFAGDIPGELLPRLTLVRYDAMWRPASARSEKRGKIEQALQEIENGYTTLGDIVGVAKVATVRAEWLLLLGDTERAQTALTQALSSFQVAGEGMATRAQRLQRLLNLSPIRSQHPGAPHFVDPLLPRDDPDPDDTRN